MIKTACVLAALQSISHDPSADPVTAEAVAIASQTPRKVALSLTTAKFESSLLSRIQAGDCRTYASHGRRFFECDGYKDRWGAVHFRAHSYWQIQPIPIVPEWSEIVGLDYDSVLKAARAADRILARGLKACHTDQGAISYFAVGHCGWTGAYRRAIFARKVYSELVACEGKQSNE